MEWVSTDSNGIAAKYAQFTHLFLQVMIPWMVRAVVFGAIFGFFFGILFSFFVNNSSDRVAAFFINPIAWAFITAILGSILGAVLATERYDSNRQAPASLPERAFAYQTNAGCWRAPWHR